MVRALAAATVVFQLYNIMPFCVVRSC